MQNKEGVFIVIEGTDGSGKGTQFKLLIERLELAGYDVATFDFPRYEEPSSFFVREYLNGKYGAADEVGPYTASLFYALDRYEAAPQIREALKAGKIVLANRFTGSNMAHQGTKFSHADERRGYFIWLDNLEFEMLHIPRPDLNIVLRVPADIAQTLVDKKEKRSYTDKKRDIHEADLSHLERAVTVYDDLCQLFPKDFMRIDCVRNEQLLAIETVSNLIWEKVFPFLPKPTRPKKVAKTDTTETPSIHTENPYLTNDATTITDMGEEHLETLVSDTVGPVYAYTNTLSTHTIAAATAVAHTRGGDPRKVLLHEFAHDKGEDRAILEEALSSKEGVDARDIISVRLTVKDVSNFVLRKLAWGLTSFSEQPVEATHFDQKDERGAYRYYIPETLDESTKRQYQAGMNSLFDAYTKIVRQLTHYIRETSLTPRADQNSDWKTTTRTQAAMIARNVLPTAAHSQVTMHLKAAELQQLLQRLQRDPLFEAQKVGKQLHGQAASVLASFLLQPETVDIPKSGIGSSYLPEQHTTEQPHTLELSDVWPRNELDMVAETLYEHAGVSLRELRTMVATWPYGKKAEVYEAYIQEQLRSDSTPGSILEKIQYTWDIASNYGTFRDVQTTGVVPTIVWQDTTPRFGYATPKLIELAGLSEVFDDCFDLSLKLFSLLQQQGYPLEAQYATLFGHIMRFKVTLTASQAQQLYTHAIPHPDTQELIEKLQEKTSEIHPILSGHILRK